MMMMAHDDSDDERIRQGGYGGTLGGWVGGSELREGGNSLILSLYCGDTFSGVHQARRKNEAI